MLFSIKNYFLSKIWLTQLLWQPNCKNIHAQILLQQKIYTLFASWLQDYTRLRICHLTFNLKMNFFFPISVICLQFDQVVMFHSRTDNIYVKYFESKGRGDMTKRLLHLVLEYKKSPIYLNASTLSVLASIYLEEIHVLLVPLCKTMWIRRTSLWDAVNQFYSENL